MLNENNFIGFYNVSDEYGCLSNWYPSEFEYAGKTYANIEQYMMYQKMMTFAQHEIADKIMAASDPAECKKLGRTKIDNWDSDLWENICYAVVKRGIKAKFFQNKDIMMDLICTRDALIAECAPNDNKWGIGIAVDDPNRFDVDKWTGQNLLGRILMGVREELRQLSEFSTNMLNRKEYFDATNLSPIPEWEMTIGELVRIPKYRNTVNAYREVCKWSSGHDVTDLSLIKIESMHRSNMGGGLPLAGFWELKQDLYEINSKMFILASGFDAPAYGKVLEEGENDPER